ncbi:chitin synthase regulator Skt5p [Monosporozyma servazzii]
MDTDANENRAKMHPYKSLFPRATQSQSDINSNDNDGYNSNSFNSNISSAHISNSFINTEDPNDSLGLGLSFEEIEPPTQNKSITHLKATAQQQSQAFSPTQELHRSNKQESPIRTTRTIISLNSALESAKPKGNTSSTSLSNMIEKKSQESMTGNHLKFPETESSTSLTSNKASSSSVDLSSSRRKKSRSVDLSHMYLLNTDSDAQLTSTNESVADISHQVIKKYLGDENNSTLVPRLKTIEMYKENVKKSKDPKILFEFAQYMLQTALTMNTYPLDDSQTTKDEQEMKTIFLKESKHYLKKLCVKGYADAQYLLADSYSSGILGKIDNKKAFSLFQTAAKHGHIESAYRTAHCYEEGIGTTGDSRKALNFLKFAASRNHPSAMFKLGLYSFYGKMGLPTDVNTKQNGIKWLSRAAARANELTAAAPYELAKIYEVGFLDIIIPDEKYAMELYIQAATLGHVPSSTLLGQIYETGNDTVSQDVSLSVHYYTQAALRGDPVAMLGVCAWYLLGAEPAFSKDEKEAFQWAHKAAISGYGKAQFTLGYFYEHGRGCEINEIAAWKWYEKAAKNKDERAINKMENRDGTNGKETSKYYKKRNNKSSRKTLSISTLNLFATSEPDTNQSNSFFSESMDDNKKSNSINKSNSNTLGSDSMESANKIGQEEISFKKGLLPSRSSETNISVHNNDQYKASQSHDNQYFINHESSSSHNPNSNTENRQRSTLAPPNNLNTMKSNDGRTHATTTPSSFASTNTDSFKFASSSETPKLLQKPNKKKFGSSKGNTEGSKQGSKKDCVIM